MIQEKEKLGLLFVKEYYDISRKDTLSWFKYGVHGSAVAQKLNISESDYPEIVDYVFEKNWIEDVPNERLGQFRITNDGIKEIERK
jgi:hypothetical protein